MKRKSMGCAAALAALALLPGAALARGLAVDVWTDRGSDAVYQPGDPMQVKVRATDDAYVLVYEIDAEGYVHVLYPYQGRSGFMEGRRTYRVPAEDSDVDLIVQGSVGQAYLVAIASRDPLERLPWYLRPYNAQAEGVGYVGRPEDEEGVTSEGRIVGDPFVAMERIRRRVLKDPEDPAEFASAYTSYYVHNEVRYPRYLCYDCHRPGRWAWWDGFDPYYARCSVFETRVNWSWGWGPSYWFGRVPYFVFVYRTDCPPRYYRAYDHGYWYSSWDGWSRWNNLWGASTLTRYKSPPPQGYVPPAGYGPRAKWGSPGQPAPPGFLTADMRRRERPGFGPASRPRDESVGRTGAGDRWSGGLRRPEGGRNPAGEARDEGDRGPGVRGADRPRGEGRAPAVEPRREGYSPRATPRREEMPSPGVQRPRDEDPRPAPAVRPRRESPPPPSAQPRRGEERPTPPRVEKPRDERRRTPPAERPDEDTPPRGKRGGG
jgi:hypothetical protein